MNEEQQPSVEQVTAEIITSGTIRREEVYTRLGISKEIFEVCLRWEIIQLPEPTENDADIFPMEAIDRLRRGIRLHQDLGINWQGVSVALTLLERIEELEQQVHNLSPSETNF